MRGGVGHGLAGKEMSGWLWHGMVRQGKVRQARRGVAGIGMVGFGAAGMDRPVGFSYGLFWQARVGLAGQGLDWHSQAR